MPNNDANTINSDTVVSTAKVISEGIKEVSLERAFDLIGELRSKDMDNDFASARVIRGFHPVMGMIYIIIQAFGGALILPFAIHA